MLACLLFCFFIDDTFFYVYVRQTPSFIPVEIGFNKIYFFLSSHAVTAAYMPHFKLDHISEQYMSRLRK